MPLSQLFLYHMYYTKEHIDNIEFEVIEKVLKKKLPALGFNIREPQIEMASEIIENKKKCLVVEDELGLENLLVI